jgi:hypothetical protein
MDFKESKGTDIAPVMQQLISAVATLLVSTAALLRAWLQPNEYCMHSTLTVALDHLFVDVYFHGGSTSGRIESDALRK